MGVIQWVIDFVLHFDQQLEWFVGNYGALTYIILFLVIFCETGLVVMPFLPGDSLLFAAGTIAATTGALNVGLLFLLFAAAAIIGDAVNYTIGKKLSKAYLSNKNNKKRRFIKQENIDKTNVFFERHGGKTIVLARFIPIIRTFAPFVAGAGEMTYHRFLSFNAAGGLLWVSLFTFSGYFFGNIQFVKDNFSMVMIAIVLISLTPVVIMKLSNAVKKGKAEKA